VIEPGAFEIARASSRESKPEQAWEERMDVVNRQHRGARLEAYEAAAQAAIADGRIPGAVAMLATGDELLHASAFGPTSRADGSAHGLDDVFMLASMTKAVTSVAAAQMLERGLFLLDQPADEILPEIAEHRVLTGFDADSKPVLRAPKSRPTMRQLFTHTSGHSSDVWNSDTLNYARVMGLPGIPTCRKAAFDLPLVFDPGTGWEYGIATDYLGRVVEQLSGLDLEAYFKRHIFDPLGMDWTSFIISPRQRARLVPVRGKNARGDFRVLDFEISQTPEQYMGGAGLYGTAGDYLKFLQMLLNRGAGPEGRVLKPETVALMFENHIGGIELPVMKTVLPAVSVDVALLPGVAKKWSLCALTNLDAVPGGRSAGSQFWAGLGCSYYWVDPARKLTGLVMMSYFPFADQDGLDVFDAFERDSYAYFAG
jgi:methyl acetate hydrolase